MAHTGNLALEVAGRSMYADRDGHFVLSTDLEYGYVDSWVAKIGGNNR